MNHVEDVPKVQSGDDFELCKALKEKGKPNGEYEVLDGSSQVIDHGLASYDALYLQFRDPSSGKFYFSRYIHSTTSLSLRNITYLLWCWTQATCYPSRSPNPLSTMTTNYRPKQITQHPTSAKGKGRHTLTIDTGPVFIHYRMGVSVFFQVWEDNGNNAAATRRPSSESRLYVEQAFL